MIPLHLHRMVRAELRKILSRGSGWAGLGIALVVPAGAVAVMYVVQQKQAEMAAETAESTNLAMQQLMSVDVYTVLSWSLQMRNFFVLPLILLAVTAQLVAGEWSGRTLRSSVLRPVPRWSVLASKFLAATLYAGLTLLVTWLGALLPGLALFPSELGVADVSMGFLASWMSDAGLIAIGILISTLSPSVVGVVVGTVLLLMADAGVRFALKGAALFGVEWADGVARWMPGQALAAWEGFSSGWELQAFGGLAILLVVTLSAATLRFQRMDIP